MTLINPGMSGLHWTAWSISGFPPGGFFSLKSQGHIRLSQRSLATMMGSAWNGTQDATWHKDCHLTVPNSTPNICRGDKGGRKETKGHCCVQNLHWMKLYAAESASLLLWHKQISAESTLPVLLRTESTLDEASNPAESALPVLQRTKSTLAQASPCRIYITCIVAGRIYIVFDDDYGNCWLLMDICG